MRVAVVFFSSNNRNKLINTSKGLVRGIEAQGHQVDLIDGDKDIGKRLTTYQYVAIGTESLGFFGKIPGKIPKFLSQAGLVAGKKSFAFIIKAFFGAQKALLNLMKSMEHEGMYLRFSDIFDDPSHAEAIGKRLHITK